MPKSRRVCVVQTPEEPLYQQDDRIAVREAQNPRVVCVRWMQYPHASDLLSADGPKVNRITQEPCHDSFLLSCTTTPPRGSAPQGETRSDAQAVV